MEYHEFSYEVLNTGAGSDMCMKLSIEKKNKISISREFSNAL